MFKMAQALTTMQNDIRELKEIMLYRRLHRPADEENDADDEAEGKSSTSLRRSARLNRPGPEDSEPPTVGVAASKNINMGKAPKAAWVNIMNVSLFLFVCLVCAYHVFSVISENTFLP
ncbi:MAG TPA: hypothetical protein VGO47_12975 [Chlamydiales bacterium]|nr:hypothetical protein [Chlamydiales bacterium]